MAIRGSGWTGPEGIRADVDISVIKRKRVSEPPRPAPPPALNQSFQFALVLAGAGAIQGGLALAKTDAAVALLTNDGLAVDGSKQQF